MKITDLPPHVLEIDPLPPMFIGSMKKMLGEQFNDLDIEDVEIDDLDIVPLYFIHYWDGPLSCVFRCCGLYFYSTIIYSLDRRWWSSWLLSEDEKELFLKEHQEFCENVSYGCDFIKNEHGKYVYDTGKKGTATVETSKQFYKKRKNDDVLQKLIEEIVTRDMFGILEQPF
jgi:hypothetical protein